MEDLNRTRRLFEIFGPMDAAARVTHLGARVKQWDDVFAEMDECCRQQVSA
ncbi:hypothetical protein BOO71_0000589 [Deinococcus marmoris]|uniref:Uncharacterized protein n=2 Tax=Deinococcus marmoris TaxID=249408 RepID=A0A1U7P4T5_9DEIO|nr:hypothetical protein BOO71_0000589 [Deinococcus marmoris]